MKKPFVFYFVLFALSVIATGVYQSSIGTYVSISNTILEAATNLFAVMFIALCIFTPMVVIVAYLLIKR